MTISKYIAYLYREHVSMYSSLFAVRKKVQFQMLLSSFSYFQVDIAERSAATALVWSEPLVLGSQCLNLAKGAKARLDSL